MPVPPSLHFTPLSLAAHFNADRERLDGGLGSEATIDWSITGAFGAQSYRGIPFELGYPGQPNVVLLAGDDETATVRIDVTPFHATYLVFLHAVEDQPPAELRDFGHVSPVQRGGGVEGNALGDVVGDYVLVYGDGSQAVTPIRRRFAIQQRHITWGASPFESVPAAEPAVFATATEDYLLGRVTRNPSGQAETRQRSGRDQLPEHLWLYALPNPAPEKEIHTIVLRPGAERALVYGIARTELAEHPLRPGVRAKLRLALPPELQPGIRERLRLAPGAEFISGTMSTFSSLDDLDIAGPDSVLGIDLGTVISARATLDYDRQRWRSDEPEVQPVPSTTSVVVEYAAHPNASLYLATGPETSTRVDLSQLDPQAGDRDSSPPVRIEPVQPALLPVRLRIIDQASRQPVAARLHLHGEAGEYLPPKGHHRRVNPHWFEDKYAEFVNGHNQYSYVPGEAVVDLPLGEVAVEISRGYEVAPIRTTVDVTPATTDLTFDLERRLPWRERGWVTADTHVHFLSPQTALLEGAAEGVNVVNLLASQWGEMFSNVGDFDGHTTIGARDFGGDGEFLVRVGTENRMQVLGHISLLGYKGPMIVPLGSGGPSESAIGDPQEVTMAEWAERCIAQGGLTVMPHAPNPQAERAADIVLELIHAIELMTFNPFEAQLSPYGLADWYRYLSLGYQLPLVGGSDKMSAASLLGGIRTYAQLGERPFTYEEWMSAVRAGNTFVTVGPLIDFTVEGQSPGSSLHLPATGGTVIVTWRVESVSVPIDQIELVVGGPVAEQVTVGGKLATASSAVVNVGQSTWMALRVRGSYRGRTGDIAAHTSAVQILLGEDPIFSRADALIVLDQIEGATAYVDTLAPRPDAVRYRLLRLTLEAAHQRLHQRFHHLGVEHQH